MGREPALTLDQFEVGLLANLLSFTVAQHSDDPRVTLDDMVRLRDKLTALQRQLDQRETEESWRAGYVEVALFALRTA